MSEWRDPKREKKLFEAIRMSTPSSTLQFILSSMLVASGIHSLGGFIVPYFGFMKNCLEPSWP